jgi:hypothetical protein
MTASPSFKVVAFAGASNWPYWAAEANGFFTREGLGVALDFTPDSIEMARNLHRGVYDLALSSIDNVIAYDEGQGEADLSGPADFVALFGVDNGLLSLVSAPSVTSFAALRGRTLSVDALTTGFAFVLKEMLELNGLGEGDATFAKPAAARSGWPRCSTDGRMQRCSTRRWTSSPYPRDAGVSPWRATWSAPIRASSDAPAATGSRAMRRASRRSSAAFTPGCSGSPIPLIGPRPSHCSVPG